MKEEKGRKRYAILKIIRCREEKDMEVDQNQVNPFRFLTVRESSQQQVLDVA